MAWWGGAVRRIEGTVGAVCATIGVDPNPAVDRLAAARATWLPPKG
jgi:hypothetical protein